MPWRCPVTRTRSASARLVVVGGLIFTSALLGTAGAQDIAYTFRGIIRVLDITSPPPGGAVVPGADPLGLDGAAVLLSCVIDAATPPSYTGVNGDGNYAFYNDGVATLTIAGSAGGAHDGTYTHTPCNIRVDDFPLTSSSGGDVFSITTSWNLGLPFPDVFQVPFARLGLDTFTGIGLQTFAPGDVTGFTGVSFSGSSDVFWFEAGTGAAQGSLLAPPPAQRISALIDAVQRLSGFNTGQVRSLTAKLQNALAALARGNDRAAANKLAAFVHEVRAAVKSRRLSAAEGQALIDEALAIIDQIRAG
jgi:hypothetical protein